MRATDATWKFIHVKRHQDDVVSLDNLSRGAQLKVHSDSLAKHAMAEFLLSLQHLHSQDRSIPFINS